MTEIGLFPLGIVLVPTERVPLHIFEERYKDLIGECLDRDAEFGLVLTDETGERSVGTRAAVVEVLHRYDDGRLDIVVEGRGRFRVSRLTEGRSFRTADVDDYEDEDEDVEHPGEAEVAECVTSFRQVIEEIGGEPTDPDPSAGSVAFQIAGRIEFGTDVKQELLEMRAERDRLERLTELLDLATEAVRLQRLAKERATGNGKVESP